MAEVADCVDGMRDLGKAAGVPIVTATTQDRFVAQTANWDAIGGLDFHKGCYPGQEIVARTRYLGRVKRRMLRFSAPGKPPPPGSAVHGQRGSIGQVVSSAVAEAGSEILAVVRLDDMTGPVFADIERAHPLTPLPLPYHVPEAGPNAAPAPGP